MEWAALFGGNGQNILKAFRKLVRNGGLAVEIDETRAGVFRVDLFNLHLQAQAPEFRRQLLGIL